ncbi:hypothetical protein D9Q98_009387 [Chlorella vulgaris]|nr:hypothetical protein D9Q98_009387 [Chlorella vulgaris]
MGPLLARLGFQLGRPALQTWQAAFVILQDLPATAEQQQQQQQQVPVSTPTSPSASAISAAGGSGGVSASTAPHAAQPVGAPQQRAYPASMQQAGRQQQSMQRELRHLSDSFQRAWLCLVTFLMSSIQVMTLWQCAVVLAACTPHFPDLVSVAAHLVDAPLPPQQEQQQQQAAFEEFSWPAGRGRG